MEYTLEYKLQHVSDDKKKQKNMTSGKYGSPYSSPLVVDQSTILTHTCIQI